MNEANTAGLRFPVSLESGPPWHISCRVERVGRDYLCRIGGGDEHVGSVALAWWDGDRVVSERLTVGIHKEGGIATDGARKLCLATRRSATCIAGIHFDGITKADIEEIVRTTHGLIARMAEMVREPTP